MTKTMTAVHFSGLKDTFRDAYLWASTESQGRDLVSVEARFDDDSGKWQGVVEYKVTMSET